MALTVIAACLVILTLLKLDAAIGEWRCVSPNEASFTRQLWDHFEDRIKELWYGRN